MSFFDSTLSNLTPLCSVAFEKLMRGSGSTAGASAYGTTSQTPRTSSRPPPPRASPSNAIDVDAINDTTGESHDGAKAPATWNSARRCRSVASAPIRPSRPLDPFAAPNYSQSAYAGSSKGQGGPSSKGGKGDVSSREEFAGIAPSGRAVISGATTGLEVLERALASWHVPESTQGGGTPPRMHPKLGKLYGPRPWSMRNTIEDSARPSQSLVPTPILGMNGLMKNGSILMKISLATQDTTTHPPSSIQRPDGSTVLGGRGRTLGHRGHPGTDRRGDRIPESRKPPAITTTTTLPPTTESTNPGS